MSEKVAFPDFEKKLVERVGTRRPNSIFCEEAGYSSSIFYSWKRRGYVPKEAFDAIDIIAPSACDKNRFKGYHRKSFFTRIVDLSNQDIPIKGISVQLTKEFGRKITEGSVKSARFRMKEQISNYRSR